MRFLYFTPTFLKLLIFNFFNYLDGEPYVLGSLKTDRWYLYTLPKPHGKAPVNGDQTLEVLMQVRS